MNTTNINEHIEPKEKRKVILFVEDLEMRDYFAAKAMQAILAYGYPVTLDPKAENKIAVAAYQQADAMLKAREQ